MVLFFQNLSVGHQLVNPKTYGSLEVKARDWHSEDFANFGRQECTARKGVA